MAALTSFFERNAPAVVFIYGTSYIVLGLAILISLRRTADLELARTFLYLALFGFIHGAADLLELTLFSDLSKKSVLVLLYIKIVLLVVSINFLLYFGLRMLVPELKERRRWMGYISPYLAGLHFLIIFVAWRQPLLSLRITKAFFTYPASLVAAYAFFQLSQGYRKMKMDRLSFDLSGVAAALVLYGIFAGLLAFPYGLQVIILGVPIRIFRAFSSLMLTFFVIRILSLFKLEK